MNNLLEKINQDVKNALKSGDTICRSVLSMLKSSILNEAIAKKKKDEGLNDDETISVIAREIKKTKEEISFLESNPELKEQRQKELEILGKYMPEQMSDDDIRKIIKEIIKSGIIDTGAIMGQAMAKLKGKADGQVVRKIVEEEL